MEVSACWWGLIWFLFKNYLKFANIYGLFQFWYPVSHKHPSRLILYFVNNFLRMGLSYTNFYDCKRDYNPNVWFICSIWNNLPQKLSKIKIGIELNNFLKDLASAVRKGICSGIVAVNSHNFEKITNHTR